MPEYYLNLRNKEGRREFWIYLKSNKGKHSMWLIKRTYFDTKNNTRLTK